MLGRVGVGGTTSATGAAASCAPTDINSCVSSVAPRIFAHSVEIPYSAWAQRVARQHSQYMQQMGVDGAILGAGRQELPQPFAATRSAGDLQVPDPRDASKSGFGTSVAVGGEQRRAPRAPYPRSWRTPIMRAFGPQGSHRRGDAVSNSLTGLLDDEGFDEPLDDVRRFVRFLSKPHPRCRAARRAAGSPTSPTCRAASRSTTYLVTRVSCRRRAAAVAPARTELLDLLPDVLSPSRSRSASFEFVAAAGGDGDGDDEEGEEVRQRRYTPSPPPQQSPQSRRPPRLSTAGALYEVSGYPPPSGASRSRPTTALAPGAGTGGRS